MNTKSILSSDAFWPINKKLLRMIGDPCATILLTDLIDKEDYHKREGELIEIDGVNYFYATSEKIEERTMLSYKRQKTLLKILKGKDLINDILHGLPAKLHFHIKHENIIKLLIEDEEKVVFAKGKLKNSPKGNNSINQRAKLEFTKGDNITRKELLRKEDKEKNNNKFNSLFPDDEKVVNSKDQRKKEMLKKAVGVVELLNNLAGRKFSIDEKSENVKFVLGLKKKGFLWDDIELMVRYKVWEWKDDSNMKIYLRPITLFKRHGERYTREAIEIKENEDLFKKVKESRDMKAGKGKNGKFNGDLSKEVAGRLKNW